MAETAYSRAQQKDEDAAGSPEAPPLVDAESSTTLQEASRDARSTFVGKVYAVLATHFTIISALGALIFNKFYETIWGSVLSIFLALVLSIGCIFVILRRSDMVIKIPMNYVIFVVLSVSFPVAIGCLLAKHIIFAALLSLGGIALTFIGLTLSAHTDDMKDVETSIYFLGGMMASISLAFLVGMVFLLGGIPHWSTIMEAFAMEFLFSLYIVHEVKAILEGTSKVSHYGVQDYIAAALFLVVDLGTFIRSLPNLIGSDS